MWRCLQWNSFETNNISLILVWSQFWPILSSLFVHITANVVLIHHLGNLSPFFLVFLFIFFRFPSWTGNENSPHRHLRNFRWIFLHFQFNSFAISSDMAAAVKKTFWHLSNFGHFNLKLPAKWWIFAQHIFIFPVPVTEMQCRRCDTT
jgi:hypothetical protein